MARQVLPIIGAAIGGYFGGPQGAQVGYMLGSIVGNAVDPQIIKGPSIGDGVNQTSKEGVPRPIAYGTGCISGNLIDRGEIRKWKKRTRQGKGGPINEEERMSLTFAIRICEGPIGGILRIWEDEKLVYDIRPESEIKEDTAKYATKFRFYNGSETQLPDPALEAIRDPGQTPSYRGTAYIVFPDLDVTDRRGSVPNFRFEVVSETVAEREAVIATSSNVFSMKESGLVEGLGLDWGIYSNQVLEPNDGSNSRHPNEAFSLSYDSQYAAVVAYESPTENVLLVKRKVGDSWIDCNVSELPSRPLRVCFSPVRNFLAVLCQNDLVLMNVDGDDIFILEEQTHARNFRSDAPAGATGNRTSRQSEISFKWDGSMICFLGVEVDGAPFDVAHIYIGRIRVTSSGFDPDEYVLTSEVSTSSTFITDQKGNFSLDQDLGDRYDVLYWNRNAQDVGTFEYYGPVIRGISAGVSPTFSIYKGDPITEFDRQIAFFLPNGNVGIIGGSALPNQAELYVLETKIESGARVFTGSFNHAFTLSAPGISNVCQSVKVIRENTGSSYLIAALLGDSAPFSLVVARWNEDGSIEQVSFETGITHAGLSIASGQASIQPGQVFLGDIVRDITLRAKVDIDALDLVDVEDMVVRGFIVSNAYNANNVIRSLQETFLFDPAEWDKKIHLVPRGKPVAAIISEADLIDEPTEETRENAREYPQKLELFYQNPDVGYSAAKAPAERVSQEYELSGTKTMESPVTMNVDEAWQLADKQLKISWEEAKGNVVLKVSSEFDHLTPTDCIAFYRRGVGSRLRIHKIEKAAGVITLTCRHDRQSAYTSNVTGLPVIPPTKPPSSITGETIFEFLNLPALVDNLDPVLHYYYGATGTSDAWYGAVIERAVENDDFEEIGRVNTNTRMGVLVDPLPYASEHYPDTTNEIVVEMHRSDDIIDGVSYSQLLRERNGAAIARGDGTAEIIQFRDVEDLGNRRYRLSYLLRGRLNSGSDTHAPGASFVLLEDVHAVSAPGSLITLELQHRPTSFNESPEQSDIYVNTWNPPLSQVEWPVALLDGTRNGNNIDVTWSPRDRFGTDVNPIRSVNWQGYRVTATDGTNSTSFDVVNPYATIDVTGWGASVTVSVSQINRFTGAGPAESVVIA